MERVQRLLGWILLLAILVFGFNGVLRAFLTGKPAVLQDELYVEECAACHMAYPAGLLPADSWARMMAGLEDHFGDNAELDAETAAEILAYLESGALRPGHPSSMSELLRNLPDPAPLRVTEMPAFVAAHEAVEVPEEVAGLASCDGCHSAAEAGEFAVDD